MQDAYQRNVGINVRRKALIAMIELRFNLAESPESLKEDSGVRG